MASARELMAPPTMSPELIADIKFMARQRLDITSETRQMQQQSTEEQAYEIYDGISQLFDKYGADETGSLNMICRGIGKTVYDVEFMSNPIGIRGLSNEQLVIKNGIWRLRADVRNDIIIPTDQEDGFFARLVQTRTPAWRVFKQFTEVKSARATASEASKAKWLTMLALNHGRVKTAI